MRFSALLASLLVVPFVDTAAQDLSLQPGQRVRVTVPSVDVSKQQATFQRVASDTLVLSSASYVLADVARLDVHRGTRSNWDRGILYGGIPVGALGLALGLVVAIDCADSDDPLCNSPGWYPVVGASAGFLAGGLVGAGIGAASRRDKWEEVPLDRLRVGVAPTPDGRVGFGLSMTF